VNVVMGNFKKKDQKCRSCGATWIAHDEKETDVHIAVQLAADAIRATCERLILISADSDLVPALNLAKQHATAPIQVFVAAPPGRPTAARALGSKLEITVGRIRKALSRLRWSMHRVSRWRRALTTGGDAITYLRLA
jgi:NYN domain